MMRRKMLSALVGTVLVAVAAATAETEATEQDSIPLPEVDVPRWTSAAPTIDGRLDEPGWAHAVAVEQFVAPWHQEGQIETTVARLAWDDVALYVAFEAQDRHVSATQSKRDDPVSRDDCVEVFFAPDPAQETVYFNYEFNALGTILDRSPRDKRSSDWDADSLQVGISIQGTLNDSTDTDNGWTAEIRIPFADLAPFAPRIPPAVGDRWRLNLYRIQDASNRQYLTWSNTLTERPQFHAPTRFGVVRFAGAPASH